MVAKGSKQKEMKQVIEKPTIISVSGFFAKKDIAEIMKFLMKIQKKVNPKNEDDKIFFIWVSNHMYSDEEVRKLIRENFKDKKIIEVDKIGIGG